MSKAKKTDVQEVAQPLSQGEKDFKAVHNPVKHDNLVPGITDQEHVFKGSTKELDNKYPNSYKPGEDVAAYDKTLRVDDATNQAGHEKPAVGEAVSYSAKKAAAGKDIGKKGKWFDKIAKKAGSKVAGAVLKNLRKLHKEEVEETVVDEAMSKNWDATHKKDSDIRHTKAPMKDYKRPGTPSKDELRARAAEAMRQHLAKKSTNEKSDNVEEKINYDETKYREDGSDSVVTLSKHVTPGEPKSSEVVGSNTAPTKEKKNPAVTPMKEDYDDYDYEGEMAKAELRAICAKADTLANMMSDDQQLEAWLQSKISRAKDQIDAVYDYLMYSNKGINSTTPADAAVPMQAPMGQNYASFLGRMGEEVEQVDEVSSDSLRKYSHAAAHDKLKGSSIYHQNPEFADKAAKRQKGIDMASKKMTKSKDVKIHAKEETVVEADDKSAKEKDLAAKAPPYDEITKKDVLVARGVLKKHPSDPTKHVLAKAKDKLSEKISMMGKK